MTTPPLTKTCTRCHRTLDTSLFRSAVTRKSSPHAVQARCRECERAVDRVRNERRRNDPGRREQRRQYDRNRNAGRKSRQPWRQTPLGLLDDNFDPATAIPGHEEPLVLRLVVAGLPWPEREVVWRIHGLEESVSEVSEDLGLSISAVSLAGERGLELLRHAVSDEKFTGVDA